MFKFRREHKSHINAWPYATSITNMESLLHKHNSSNDLIPNKDIDPQTAPISQNIKQSTL